MRKTTIILVSSLCLFTSCTHYYYAPNANNVPLFKEKYEARIQGQASSGHDFSGFDIQTAYAAGKNIGLQLNFFHASIDDHEFGSGHGNYIEAAGGYFLPSHNKHWIFEGYTGFGTGSVINNYSGSQSAKTGVTKIFIQPSFGFTSKHFNMAVSSKLSLVDIGVKQYSLTKNQNSSDYNYIKFLESSKPFFFWEPGVMISGGFKNFQIITQITHTVAEKSKLAMDDTNMSLGIIVPFKIKSGTGLSGN